MKEVTVTIVQAFVADATGGNPAGVVLNAERFTTAEKQTIAAQVGCSETAFISPSDIADYKLDFFTPARQIPDCGHATVGAFSYLVQSGTLTATTSSKETLDGRRDIFLRGDMAYMEQSAPSYTSLDAASAESLLQILGSSADQLQPGRAPMVVNTEVNFLIVPLASQSDLAALKPDMDALATFTDQFESVGVYAFSLETILPTHAATTRMFAPAYGIPEESATGMAAGPLACYLHDQVGLPAVEFVIEQGYLMSPASPSLISAEIETVDGHIQRVLVGGRGIVGKEVTITF